MKSLVVDDDFAARTLLQRLLSKTGDVDLAVDGKKALNAFKEAFDQGDRFDLICLDIMMPEMDGHQTLKAIRQYEEEAGLNSDNGVKVIMTTAMDSSQHVLDAFREGCEAYVVKPVNKAELFGEIYKLGLSVPAS